MFRPFRAALALVISLLVLTAAQAATDRRGEVEALMSQAVAHYQKVGAAQAAKDFADKSGPFFKGDLYVVIHGIDGSMVAHPVAPGLNGRDQLVLKDTDGKAFVYDLCDAARAGGGWVEYKWSNPATKKIAPKVAYAKPVTSDHFLIIGYYK